MKTLVFGLKKGVFQSRSEENHLKKGSDMLECYTAVLSVIVDLNLIVAERPIGQYGKRKAKKRERSFLTVKEVYMLSRQLRGRNKWVEASDCTLPRLSSLVVVGRIGEGKL